MIWWYVQLIVVCLSFIFVEIQMKPIPIIMFLFPEVQSFDCNGFLVECAAKFWYEVLILHCLIVERLDSARWGEGEVSHGILSFTWIQSIVFCLRVRNYSLVGWGCLFCNIPTTFVRQVWGVTFRFPSLKPWLFDIFYRTFYWSSLSRTQWRSDVLLRYLPYC